LACPLTLTPFTQSVIGLHVITSSLTGVLELFIRRSTASPIHIDISAAQLSFNSFSACYTYVITLSSRNVTVGSI